MSLEILAPAGSYEAALAAVRCGADAVYLGSKFLNARRNAANFDGQQLRDIVCYAHERGVKIYLTLNIMVLESELPQAVQAVQLAADSGVDAVIVQDLAVAALVRRCCPSLRLHASTQMSIHNLSGVRQLEKLGFSRVVLARELSAKEVSFIAQNTSMELEVFVHGALCMCVSGQCYLSAMLGERSGNRGLCAQPCRLPFFAKEPGRHNLSLKDLSLIPRLRELESLGVTSAKIEGRMKRPEYIAAAVRAAKQAAAKEEIDLEPLEAVFSRSGFTDGYWEGRLGAQMFGIRQKEDVLAASSQVLKELARLYDRETPLVPLTMEFFARSQEPMRLILRDAAGHESAVSGEFPQLAREHPTTSQRAQQNLSKLGGTPYFITEARVQIQDGLMLPASQLNSLRRQAVEQLSALRQKAPPSAGAVNLDPCWLQGHPVSSPPSLRARFSSLRQLEGLTGSQRESLERMILPAQCLTPQRVRELPDAHKLMAAIPRAVFEGEAALLEHLKGLRTAGVRYALCQNLGALTLAQQAGLIPCGGFGLNAANSVSASQLARLGLAELTFSFESPLSQLGRIESLIPCGILAYGRLPLMLMRNCPVKIETGCKECKARGQLCDRKGIHFPVECPKNTGGEAFPWASGAVELLNSRPLYLADRLGELNQFDFLTLYFTRETPEEASRIVKEYVHSGHRENITRGLYYRNLL